MTRCMEFASLMMADHCLDTREQFKKLWTCSSAEEPIPRSSERIQETSSGGSIMEVVDKTVLSSASARLNGLGAIPCRLEEGFIRCHWPGLEPEPAQARPKPQKPPAWPFTTLDVKILGVRTTAHRLKLRPCRNMRESSSNPAFRHAE